MTDKSDSDKAVGNVARKLDHINEINSFLRPEASLTVPKLSFILSEGIGKTKHVRMELTDEEVRFLLKFRQAKLQTAVYQAMKTHLCETPVIVIQ